MGLPSDFVRNWLLLCAVGMRGNSRRRVIHISTAVAVIFLASQVAGARRRCSRSAAIHGAAHGGAWSWLWGAIAASAPPTAEAGLPEMKPGPLVTRSASADSGERRLAEVIIR